jgi:hypothetical protein
MSFCGTPKLNRRFRMLGFGMHCSALAHKLLHMLSARAHAEIDDGGCF